VKTNALWMLMACLLATCVASTVLPRSVLAQPGPAPESADTSQWFLGAYYRHVWVPKLLLKPLLERGSSISNDGFGFTASHVQRGGVTAELGVGYVPYRFAGAFNPRGSSAEDTEYATSTLGLIHFTGSLLWPIELQRTLTLELGVGVDFGMITGKLLRTEAYPDASGRFHPCQSALHPGTTGPNSDAKGPIPYCDQALDARGQPVASNPADVSGAHYGAKETRIPPVMLIPMLPHVALRFAPVEWLALKLEAAFGVAQLWVGVSAQIGLGSSAEAAPPAPAVLAPPPAPHRLGRVLGKLFEISTSRPIAGAAVKSKRVFSAVQTDATGLFLFDNVEPGPLPLTIAHPDYEAGSCEAAVGPQGGETFVHCFLRPKPSDGAISGQLKDEQGTAIAGARVEITGPLQTVVTSDASGLFAVPEAREGTYRLRVAAAGYLPQLVEIEVRVRETSMPQIILLKAPTNP
jgi:hypothetical protein